MTKKNSIFKVLGINKDEITSLYRYSPVYKIKIEDKHCVLKTTKKEEERAQTLFKWENFLSQNGVDVVTPVKTNGKESVICEGKRWVIYPFIDGRVYSASLEDVEKSGELLGKIHKVSSNHRVLLHEFKWEEDDSEFYDELKGDIDFIKEKYSSKLEGSKLGWLEETVDFCIKDKFSTLKKVKLPKVDGVWDYKAANLIYKDKVPVLIDPDNSAYIPRILDLALALLLFHTAIDTAPPRVFTIEEWKSFKKGYFKYIQVTDLEKKMWQEMLTYVYIDEVLWAITDLEDDETDRQKAFIKSLIDLDLSIFKL